MYGQGNVYRRADGSWEAKVSVNGVRKSFYAATRPDAVKALAAANFEAGRGYAENITVAEYLERWLQDTVAHTTRARTQEAYRYTVERYVVPAIGALRLTDLRPTSMDGLQAGLRANGTPEPTIRYAASLLRTAVRAAARKEVIPRNPFEGLRLARPPKAKRPTWTAAEATAFLAATEGHPLAALFALGVWCGLRHGELLALRWSDFANGTLTVRHTLEWANGKFDPNHPVKSESGARTLAVPSAAAKAVATLRAQKLANGTVDEFLFTTSTGAHFHQSTVTSAFKRLAAKAGVPVIRVHDLRHTCATLATAAGVDLNQVKAQLGHSDIAVTQLYAHVESSSGGFVVAMEKALGGGK